MKPLNITQEQQEKIKAYDRFTRTRLSKNFILRDFLYSARCDVLGMSNMVSDDPELVVRAGKSMCEKVCEPILARWGRFSITYGYQSRTMIEAGYPQAKKHSSAPHQWDRGTFGKDPYARIDILPFCVEDGSVDKLEFAAWIMYNCDVDLLMLWQASNVFCITIGPKPRRVCVEWTPYGKGVHSQNSIIHMGEEFWTKVYPGLPPDKKPRFGPSWTNGSMNWS